MSEDRAKTLKTTLMGAAAAALIAFMSYLGIGDAQQSERIRAVEVHADQVEKRLERIEEKIDRLLVK